VNSADVWSALGGTLVSLIAVAAVILVIILGLTLLLGLVKVRLRRGADGARSLDDRLGLATSSPWVASELPHGPVDQWRAGTSGRTPP
jgi:hypothetical protein